jgi:hypothetical protein
MTEREKIVAWLRKQAEGEDRPVWAALRLAATQIERGEHLHGETVAIPMIDPDKLGDKTLGEVWQELLKG